MSNIMEQRLSPQHTYVDHINLSGDANTNTMSSMDYQDHWFMYQQQPSQAFDPSYIATTTSGTDVSSASAAAAAAAAAASTAITAGSVDYLSSTSNTTSTTTGPPLSHHYPVTSPASSSSTTSTTSPNFPPTPPPPSGLYQDSVYGVEYVDPGYTAAPLTSSALSASSTNITTPAINGVTPLASPLSFDYTLDPKMQEHNALLTGNYFENSLQAPPSSAPPTITTFEQAAEHNQYHQQNQEKAKFQMLQPPIRITTTTKEDKPKGRKKSTSTRKSSASGAPPGPIPATTPTLVKRDENGVEWISFEYSKERVKTKYFIRCDIESVDHHTLEPTFKKDNCIYPRACVPPEQYTGNRQKYETECNAIGWCLSYLNPELRAQRGLIQRAVDSWRNTNADPTFRSRRVRRMSKKNSITSPSSSTTKGGGVAKRSKSVCEISTPPLNRSASTPTLAGPQHTYPGSMGDSAPLPPQQQQVEFYTPMHTTFNNPFAPGQAINVGNVYTASQMMPSHPMPTSPRRRNSNIPSPFR